MRIGVLGVGTVGSAVADGFEALSHTVIRYDPNKGYDGNINGSDVIFVCIYDYNDLDNVISIVNKQAKIVVIKTTCPVGLTDELIKSYGDHIVFSPEFLCEKTANEDFLNPDKIIIGTENQDVADLLLELFLPFNSRMLMMKPREAEILKLAINTFYCTKVEYFNEVADLCKDYGVSYSNVRKGLEDDRFIANQHLDVDKDGYRGYGGKCLPKDIRLFLDSWFREGGNLGINIVAVVEMMNRDRIYE